MSLLKLLQLSSPSLPVGAYSYSQGLEWAIETGWVSDLASFTQWAQEQLDGTIAQQDLPLLHKMFNACQACSDEQLRYWDSVALAMRETRELRDEEIHRGRAMASLLTSFGIDHSKTRTNLACVAAYCVHEKLSIEDSLSAYAYSWLDNLVTAGIKLVPLGQTQGQKILFGATENIMASVAVALDIEDDDIGYSCPALAIASSQHETQYSRLFRS